MECARVGESREGKRELRKERERERERERGRDEKEKMVFSSSSRGLLLFYDYLTLDSFL